MKVWKKAPIKTYADATQSLKGINSAFDQLIFADRKFMVFDLFIQKSTYPDPSKLILVILNNDLYSPVILTLKPQFTLIFTLKYPSIANFQVLTSIHSLFPIFDPCLTG